MIQQWSSPNLLVWSSSKCLSFDNCPIYLRISIWNIQTKIFKCDLQSLIAPSKLCPCYPNSFDGLKPSSLIEFDAVIFEAFLSNYQKSQTWSLEPLSRRSSPDSSSRLPPPSALQIEQKWTQEHFELFRRLAEAESDPRNDCRNGDRMSKNHRKWIRTY